MEKSLPRIFGELLADGGLCDDDYLRLMRLVTLPRPSQLADVVAATEESLFISSEDIAEFYHSLWPPARWHENAVGPLVRPSEILPLVRDEARRRHLTEVARATGDAALAGLPHVPGHGRPEGVLGGTSL